MLEIVPRFQVFLANRLLRMRRNDQNSTSGQMLNPKFETTWAGSVFPIRIRIGGRLFQDLCVFLAKNGFCNAKFLKFGGYWGGVIIFDETPKRHIPA